MNKIGIAAIATAVISSAASAANTDVIGNIDLSKNWLGDNIKLNRADKDTTLYSTNWSSFTAGSAVGQDSWANYGGTTAAFTITATRPGGQAGQGYSQAQSGTSSRYFYRDLSTEFAGRGAGENSIWASYSQYLGATGTVRGRAGGSMFDNNGYVSGMRMEIGTNTTAGYAFGKVQGLAYLTDAAAAALGATVGGNYSFTFNTGTRTAPVPTANSWVYFAHTRDLSTGRVTWYYSVDGGANYSGFYVDAGVTTSTGVEFDYITSGGQTTTSFTAQFGDMQVYTTPAPGAAALVGLAGLVSRRRR